MSYFCWAKEAGRYMPRGSLMILGLVRTYSVLTSDDGVRDDRNQVFEIHISIMPRDSGFKESLREGLIEEHT
jgi:hypothetical protein